MVETVAHRADVCGCQVSCTTASHTGAMTLNTDDLPVMTCLTTCYITSGVAISQHTTLVKHHSDVPCIVMCRQPRVGWPCPSWRSQGQPFRRCGALHTRDCPQRAGQNLPSVLHVHHAAQPIQSFLSVWLLSPGLPWVFFSSRPLLTCLLAAGTRSICETGRRVSALPSG